MTGPKELFNRCMRLFFVFQRQEAYEQLMLHDYGFYKFEKFQSYTQNKNLKHSKPLFETRQQWLVYDECQQVISSFMQYYDLKIKQKDYQGKLGYKMAKYLMGTLQISDLKSDQYLHELLQ